MPDHYMRQLAAASGLPYYANKGPFGQKEGAAIGNRDGYVLAVGPTKNDQGSSAIGLLVRFPALQDTEPLKASIKEGMKGYKGNLSEVGESFVRWTWNYTFKKPAAEEVANLLPPLLEAVKKAAPGFGGKCEVCRSTSTSEITLLNRVPGCYCDSCQQKMQMELSASERAYEEVPLNVPNGVLFGVVAALVGSILWGGVAYLLNRIFLIGAVGIGFLVAWAVMKGIGRTNLFAKVLIGVLTVASVLFGDAIYFTLSAMKELEAPFSLSLLKLVLDNFVELESNESGAFSILFALVGAGYAVYHARKPSFTAQFERLGEPTP